MRGLDPRIHPGIELRFRAMDCRHRRAEATPSFGGLCPAMTLMLRIAIHIQLSNSERMRVRVLAARCARSDTEYIALENRGRREDRVRAAPAVSRAIAHRERAHEHTGSAEAFRPSLRSGFTAYFVLSPVNGSFATVIGRSLASRRFDASTAASGPHDFAVRVMRLRLLRTPRSPHLTATFVTIASRPSSAVRRTK